VHSPSPVVVRHCSHAAGSHTQAMHSRQAKQQVRPLGESSLHYEQHSQLLLSVWPAPTKSRSTMSKNQADNELTCHYRRQTKNHKREQGDVHLLSQKHNQWRNDAAEARRRRVCSERRIANHGREELDRVHVQQDERASGAKLAANSGRNSECQDGAGWARRREERAEKAGNATDGEESNSQAVAADAVEQLQRCASLSAYPQDVNFNFARAHEHTNLVAVLKQRPLKSSGSFDVVGVPGVLASTKPTAACSH
jgi:hypothetical protein